MVAVVLWVLSLVQEVWIALQAVEDGRMKEAVDNTPFPWLPTGDGSLDAAQALMRTAVRKTGSLSHRDERLALARDALATSPKCSDALIEMVGCVALGCWLPQFLVCLRVCSFV